MGGSAKGKGKYCGGGGGASVGATAPSGAVDDDVSADAAKDTSRMSPTAHPLVETLQDLTKTADVKASSRQAMVASLVDSSTETFWESGDEDRYVNSFNSLQI